MGFLQRISASLVLASPLEIEDTDFRYEDADFNQGEYAKYREASQVVHKFSDSIGLFKAKDHFFVFDDAKYKVLFCVKYTIIPFLSYNLVVQKKIWRDSALSVDAFKMEGMSVASYVFFNYLLPLADGVGIITDSMQTPSGKRFWFDRIAQSFAKNLHVYLLDRNKKLKIELVDDADFKAKIKQENTWSAEDNKSLNRRIVITEKKLI
jgi:hypothetical protein